MQLYRQVTAPEWDRFVVSHPEGHILQTSLWGELKSAYGWQAERIAARRQGVVVAGAQVLFRRLAQRWTVAYVPKGPLANEADAVQLFAALHQLCRPRRAIMLKIEPDRADSPTLTAQLAGLGFRPGSQTIQPRHTILIDLSGSEDDILQSMKSKTRYNIRLAERKGVCVVHGGVQDVAAFNRLMAVTGQRDGFGIHSPDYYERAFELFAPSDMACLFMATYEGQPIAGLMAFACGRKAWYMYGASGDEHRDKMPNYALQWAAIQWAKARGCETFDLWGVPDEDEETLEASFAERSDGLWGVYRFKRGFGGRLVRYLGAYDYVYRPFLYRLYHLLLRAR